MSATDWTLDLYIGLHGLDERAERMLDVWALFVVLFTTEVV